MVYIWQKTHTKFPKNNFKKRVVLKYNSSEFLAKQNNNKNNNSKIKIILN